MAAPTSDRNLLVGILALQMDFVDRDQLVAGMSTWVLDKSRPLEEILLSSGALQEDTHALLVTMATKHLELHGGKPNRSLQHLGAIGELHAELTQIADDDIDTSLSHVTVSHPQPETPDEGTLLFGGKSAPEQRFQILRPHARGGLGEVFIARDRELNREVALKRIRSQFREDEESRARFTIEAETTGGLEHPNIVPVYGMGLGDDGHPYYAMRLIHGESLKQGVRSFHKGQASGRRPSLTAGDDSVEFRRLLGRLCDVCDAIEYAHSRGIVHRDIKPANIMLGKYGETLVVDWGLAKAVGRIEQPFRFSEPTLHPSGHGSSTATTAGSAVGTPAYMSPEQASGRLQDIGPPSDVYSLGATLYFVLTGRAPIEEQDVETSLRRVNAGDFTRPRELNPGVPRALESICLKAMAPAPNDRYVSALALSEDIQRWLADEPVSACREPFSIRFRRGMRRHQSLVAGSAAAVGVALASLLLGVFFLSSKNRELAEAYERENKANTRLVTANENEQQARRQAQRRFDLALDAIDDYYTGVSHDVLLQRADLRELRTDLLKAPLDFYQRLQAELSEDADPVSRESLARAFNAIARITSSVGSMEQAMTAHEEAVAILEQLVAANPEDTTLRSALAKSCNSLGVVQRETGRSAESLQTYERALSLRRRIAAENPDNPKFRDDLAESYNNLGNLQRDTSRASAALESYQRALAIREELAEEHDTVLSLQRGLARSYNNVGVIQREMGDVEDAVSSYRRAVALRLRIAEEHPDRDNYQDDLASTYNNLSVALRLIDQEEEALRVSQRSVEIREALVAASPNIIEYQQGLAATYNNLANLQRSLGKTDEAMTSLKRVVSTCEKLLADNPTVADVQNGVATSYHSLAVLYRRLDDEAEAIKCFQRAVELRRELTTIRPGDTENQNDLARSLQNLGVLFRSADRKDEARQAYLEAIAIRTRLLANDPDVRSLQDDLAGSYNNLGNLYTSLNQTDKAFEALSKALEIQEAMNKVASTRSVRSDLGRSYHNLAVLRRRMGEKERAVELWTQAIEFRGALVSEKPKVSSYRDSLLKSIRLQAEVLDELERFAEAAAVRRQAVPVASGSRRRALRLQIAESLARSADYTEATEVAAEVATSDPEADTLFTTACIHALAAARVQQDLSLEAGQRRERQAQYAAAAITLLRRAGEAGCFAGDDSEKLIDDVRLDPLRDRDDFQALLKSYRPVDGDDTAEDRGLTRTRPSYGPGLPEVAAVFSVKGTVIGLLPPEPYRGAPFVCPFNAPGSDARDHRPVC